jgi:hypothetical protein
VEDQLRVETAPALNVVGLAVSNTVGGGGGGGVVGITWIVTELSAEPPAPVQIKAKLVVTFRAGVTAVPLVLLGPVHPPEAVHELAFVEDHVRVAEAPGLSSTGVAPRDTDGKTGAGLTWTVTDLEADPPAPVQFNVKLVVVPRPAIVSVPLTGRAPLHPPEAVHELALVTDHASAVDAPATMAAGAAVNVSTGSGELPPEPPSEPPPPHAHRPSVRPAVRSKRVRAESMS